MVTDIHCYNKLHISIFPFIHLGHLHIDKIINTIIINLINIGLIVILALDLYYIPNHYWQ